MYIVHASGDLTLIVMYINIIQCILFRKNIHKIVQLCILDLFGPSLIWVLITYIWWRMCLWMQITTNSQWSQGDGQTFVGVRKHSGRSWGVANIRNMLLKVSRKAYSHCFHNIFVSNRKPFSLINHTIFATVWEQHKHEQLW